MAGQIDGQLLDRVRSHAFSKLSWPQRERTNLYIDLEVYGAGRVLGPAYKDIKTDRSTILVFADDDPRANFAHDCRYFLYDATSGSFYREVPARFPPYVQAKPTTFRAFHEPVSFTKSGPIYHVPAPFHCPIIIPRGKRYAILYAGSSNSYHLNDMEFLYRTLMDVYCFDADNIYALNYRGTLETQDGVQTNWPGDGTPYRINVTGKGTQAAFEAAIDDLKGKLGPEDLLLVHTNGHGNGDETGNMACSSYLLTFDGSPHYADDFARKLGELPRFRGLIVMMEQCFAGGFNGPILSYSTADATSVSSAAGERTQSYPSTDGNWDLFARNWISAQAGYDPFGAPLAFNPDTDWDGQIEAEEAHSYADILKTSYPDVDTPFFSESSDAGGELTLGQEYTIWWWCDILTELLEPYYSRLPRAEYNQLIRHLQPDLASLAQELDTRSSQLRDEYKEKLNARIIALFP